MTVKLSDFPHGTAPPRADARRRVTAGLLTALVYGVVAVLLLTLSLAPPPAQPQAELVTAMVSAPSKPDVVDPVPPVPDKTILPRTEQPAPPVIVTETGAPLPSPAPLPATAATQSPMVGGTSGNGPMGQSASGNGGAGNGGGAGGCLDPVWMRAVSERVRQFFYYPGPALAARTTGVVMMRFAVRRDGRLDQLEIGKSSGDAGLDQAATDILRKAQPLPPIPARMNVDRIVGELPINFGVRSFNAQANAGSCAS
jgi:protein TonB